MKRFPHTEEADDGWKHASASIYDSTLRRVHQGDRVVTSGVADVIRSFAGDWAAIVEYESRTGNRFRREDAQRLIDLANATEPCFICKKPLPKGEFMTCSPACRKIYKERYR